MGSIFNTLNIGYSGLNAAQVGIDVTGHNIVNAETEGYSRQRVVNEAATPLSAESGQIGNGVEILDVKRIFDNFVFDRYNGVSSDKEYSDFETKTLEELSTYFPEVDGVGVKADLAEYYNMWQTFSDNPDNDSIKIALAKQTETLSQHITQTQFQVKGLQSQVNEELSVDINEVNELAEQLATLNGEIDTAEAGGNYSANDLRDKRNVLERSLSRLIGADVNSGQLEANIQIDSNSNTKTGSYTLSVNGFNIVDGNSFHSLHITNDSNANGFYEISYERQDGVLVPLEEKINGGKVGAILDLRGGEIDPSTGVPADGILQDVVSQLDAFTKGLVEATNNLYASSATTKMDSNIVNIGPSDAILSSDLTVNKGTFNLIIYDIDGNEVSRRDININDATSMSGTVGSNSIQGQIKNNIDDNNDGNANNDIDDYIIYNFQQSADGTTRLEFSMNSLSASQGYTFGIEDKLETTDFSSGTNFAGALGLNRFFDGDNASNINLTSSLRDNPTNVNAGYSSTSGDNRVALNMVQQQFESYGFDVNGATYDTTIYGMFDITSTFVGISTNSAISRNETVTTQFNATELEYFSVSKVSVDEEMTNLIKYQASYGAAAKIITTVDEMMQTLLGIKQ